MQIKYDKSKYFSSMKPGNPKAHNSSKPSKLHHWYHITSSRSRAKPPT